MRHEVGLNENWPGLDTMRLKVVNLKPAPLENDVMALGLPSWPNAPETINALTRAYLDEAASAGVEVVWTMDDTVAYPNAQAQSVSGYFVDRPTPALGVALGGDWRDRFPVFVHERCHAQQWQEQVPVWTHLFRDGVEAADWFDRWIEGEDLAADQVQWAGRAIRAVEMDCERRVLAEFQKHAIPLEPIVYAQKANAYVLFYHYAQAHRYWRPDGVPAPYLWEAVWRTAPTSLGDPEMVPTELWQAFCEHYPVR